MSMAGGFSRLHGERLSRRCHAPGTRPFCVRVADVRAVAAFAALLAASASAAPAGFDQFKVNGFKGTVREWHVWQSQKRLLIGTIDDGLWSWNAEDAAPAHLDVDLGRVLAFYEWEGMLWIGTEKGVWVWKSGSTVPESLDARTGGAYEFLEWGKDLVIRAGDGAYRIAAGTSALTRIAGNEQFFWPRTMVVWQGQLYYGNLGGLFSV